MKIDDFFREAKDHRLSISHIAQEADYRKSFLLSNEALFQTPFLAMVVLTLAKGKRKPTYSEIGQLVGECLERTLVGFKGSTQHIGWSANLRIRTIKALSFLEMCALANVNQTTKAVNVTPRGRQVLDAAMEDDGNLAETLRHIERSFRNVSAEADVRREVK
jgi:hypothetical protein